MNNKDYNEELKQITYREYLTMLFIEFCKSQGLDFTKERMEERENQFKAWINEMFIIKNRYADLAANMLYDSRLIGELGKGKYNSIVPNLNDNGLEAIAISTYLSTFNNGEVIGYNGKVRFAPYSDEVEIKYESPKIQACAPNIRPNSIFEQIDTLITQLPIGNVSLRPLIVSSRLHNDVAIGTYGFIEDKDLQEKLNLLKRIKEEITSQYCVGCDEEYIRENGSYLYLLKSNQKTLVRERILTR